jgi:hypothetical protein
MKEVVMKKSTISSAILLTFFFGVLLQTKVGAQAPLGRPVGSGNVNGPRTLGSNNNNVETLPPEVARVSDRNYRVTDSRPLARVANFLEKKLAVPISYEDPAWSNSADMVQAGDILARRNAIPSSNPTWRGPLVPREGSVDVVLPALRGKSDMDNALSVLQDSINNHRTRRNSGEFKVLQLSDGQLSIVPDRVADKDGRMIAQPSLLDLRISFPEAERTRGETLKLICQALSAAGKVSVNIGSIPNEAFPKAKVQVGANSAIAREVLLKTLKVPGDLKYSWILSHDPEGKFGYILSLHGVAYWSSNAPPGSGVLYLTWPPAAGGSPLPPRPVR